MKKLCTSNGLTVISPHRLLGPALLAVIMVTCPARASAITAELVASGLSRPLYVTSVAGDVGRLFIVEQHTGRIKVLNLNTGMVNTTPFLDLDGLATGNEQGLLGLAFHPDYAVNGFFYVNFTGANGTTNIRRYRVSTVNPDLADEATGTTVMTYSQPFANHNGGWLGFGPDGFLYICSGDGGSGNDPGNRAQDITDQRLGKIMRIDINGDDFQADSSRNYAIPADNPFVGTTGDDEIWAYGLRNPWRASFDRLTGDLYIADVGQNQREEIDFQPASSKGGENYGWRVMEGTNCNFPNDPSPCNDPSFTPPIYEYLHTGGLDGGYSITGGYVYRGPIHQLQGTYFFADYVSNQIWSFRFDGTEITDFTNRTAELSGDGGSVGSISSFGEDVSGNLYIVDLDGEVFKIVCGPGDSLRRTTRRGDFDGDCDIDLTDFAAFASAWLSTSDQGRWNRLYDISEPEDGVIDMLDLDVFASNWLSDFRLAAHWKLDEAESTIAGDIAGDNDGTLHGNPLWRPSGGAIRGALEFDGVDDYVSTPFVLDPADGPFSAYAWVRTDVPGRTIVSQAYGAGTGETWIGTEPLQGKLISGLVPAASGRVVPPALASEYVITDGLWHHIGFVWDGSLRRLYVDKVEVAEDDSPIALLKSSKSGLYIGAGEGLDAASFWSGLIDDTRVYDQAVEP
ncbi:MAG: PQQ-dependent sugar dehydrogenase [Planctomycetota bacterium]